MVSGKKKQTTPQNKALNELQPTQFFSPLGDLTGSTRNLYFQPTMTEGQTKARDVSETKLLDALRGIPSHFDTSAAFNNPFYDSTYKLLSQPVDNQYERDSRELNNRLSAQNQLGSSYDVLQRDTFNRRYDQLRNQASLQARQASFDAYNQNLQNSLNTVQALRNERSQALGDLLSPAQFALSSQNTLSPLKMAQAQIRLTQPEDSSDNRLATALRYAQLAAQLAQKFV